MTHRVFLVASTLLIGAGIAVAIGAQQPRPQTGAPERPQPPAAEPNRLGQPLLDPNGFVRDDAMLKSTLLPEDRKYGDIDGRHLKQLVMEVDAISLKDRDSGNLFWGRRGLRNCRDLSGSGRSRKTTAGHPRSVRSPAVDARRGS